MRRSTRTALIVFLSTTATSWAQSTPPVCAATCLHGANCTTCSPPNYIGDIEICRDGTNCDCPPGKSGLRCGHDYESCEDTGHECFNGGQCIEGLKDVYGNTQYYCDCNNAKDSAGHRYAGKYCEMKAVELCDGGADRFCVNEKSCLTNATPSHFCHCGSDYEGPHCEFKKGSVPKCDMKCENNGECMLGIKSYPMAVLGYNDFWQSHSEAMYCNCPEGFFGLKCEVSSQKCGDHHCFHGGTCVTSVDSNGKQTSNCDCSSASSGSASYAGKYCQYESTSFCEKTDTIEGQDFCVNGGECKSGKPGCNCPDGFGGPLCEYNTTLDGNVQCSLQCVNGQCRKGSKDMSFLTGIYNLARNQTGHTADFEHCICPEGFYGILCDKTIELCDDGQHVCLNNSTCAAANDGSYTCDCSKANTPTSRFAGSYCQHEASTYCTADNKPGLNKDMFAFCVNGGTCKGVANGNGHPGCDCSDNYVGDHCEEPLTAVATKTSRTPIEGFMISVLVFGSVVFVLSFAIWIRVSRRKKNYEKEMALRDASMCAPAPTHSTVHYIDDDDDDLVLDMGPERDHEGNELSNVEII